MEKYRTKLLDYSAPSIERHHSQAAPMTLRQPTGLATKQARSPQSADSVAPMSYLGLWLRSGKNLDFCLLAVCSCVLSLLCHQSITVLPSAPTVTSGSAATTVPATNLSRIDLLIKAGLFTTSSQKQKEKD